ncbi:MAG TPA: radical SAM protein, partial [Planctomycetota bacterium]|nr:radical SAM protein [Planctomycetota bacterium]
FAELEGFHAAAEVAASADALVATVDDAKRVLRSEACFDPDRYVPAVRTLYQGLRLVSAAHFPSRWTPHDFTMRHGNDRSEAVLAATEAEAENPFLAWYREVLLPRLVARRPRVLGLSVIYGSQLVPALTLGRLVKRALPDCHVTAGGGFLAYIGEKLLRAPGVDQCLDSIVHHEGEAPLLGLCEALRDGRPLDAIGSLHWYDRGAARDARGALPAVRNAPGHPIRLDAAPPPDFDGLPFERYFSPEIVIPYDVNRGCYYGECTFCTLPTVIGPGYRTRSAATIVDHVLALKDRHATRNFNFVTDCMPPGMIRDLPDELLRRGAGIRWWSDARVEPKAYDDAGARRLYEAGCRKLLFGFETATPRLLKLMQKGQSLKSTVAVAEACARAGISVTFYAMVGFPSETREEARATLDFLVAHSDAVREVSLQTFHVDEVAQTFHEPERFGLRILDEPGADLQLYHDYESESGMTQAEAAEAFEELMAGLRGALPIFAGDNFFYFMQKSHYFLHLARDVTPDAFV